MGIAPQRHAGHPLVPSAQKHTVDELSELSVFICVASGVYLRPKFTLQTDWDFYNIITLHAIGFDGQGQATMLTLFREFKTYLECT